MNTRPLGLVLLTGAFIAGLLLVLFGAQEIVLRPAQAQSPDSAGCNPPFQRGPGGQTISAGLVRVDLPAGYNYLWNAPDVGVLNGSLRICIIEYSSQVVIDTNTGRERSRLVVIPSAAPVLDLIVASARLIIPPTPTAAPSVGSGGAGGAVCTSVICPPNTGEAGLRWPE